MTARKQRRGDTLKAQEFARLAGVTVRALHHYERLGLLQPSGRSAAGYRLYKESDLVRLQQILTLKFIGLSLNQIREALNRNNFDLIEALRTQREVLRQKHEQIGRAMDALLSAERAAQTRSPRWRTFGDVIQIIEMYNHSERTKFFERYFSEEQRKDMKRRADPHLAAEGTRKWMELIWEVESAAAAKLDPASPKAQDLARRWSEVMRSFLQWAGQGDPRKTAEVRRSLKKMYTDSKNWPAGFTSPYSDACAAFIKKAQAAKRK